jgi:hypothetical protein
MSKPFKIQISFLFIILFHEILHSYNNLIRLSESVSKGHKHPLIYIYIFLKLNKKILKVYTSHSSPCDFTHTLKWQRLFTCIIICESIYIIETMTKPLWNPIPNNLPKLIIR